MTNDIIGVEGLKRSGKSTFGQGLTDIGWRPMAFADALRRELLSVNPVVVPEGPWRRASDVESPTQSVEFLRLCSAFARALDHLHLDSSDWNTVIKAVRDLDPIIAPGGERLTGIVAAMGWEKAKDTYPEVRRLMQRYGTESVRENYGDSIWYDITLAEASESDTPIVITDVRFPNEALAIRAAGGVLVKVRKPGIEVGDDPHPSEASFEDLPFDVEVINDSTIESLHEKARAIASGR